MQYNTKFNDVESAMRFINLYNAAIENNVPTFQYDGGEYEVSLSRHLIGMMLDSGLIKGDFESDIFTAK